MLGKKKILGIAVSLAIMSGSACLADTIIVTQDAGTNVALGIYKYDITLDSSAYVETNDGFALFNFQQFIAGSATLTDTTGSLIGVALFGAYDGSGVSPLNAPATVIANAKSSYHGSTGNNLTDGPNIIIWNPGSTIVGAGTGVLELDSSLLGSSQKSEDSTVDHSSPGYDLAFDQKEILVAAVPAPSTALGGAVLLGLLGVYRLRKAAMIA